MQHLFKSCRILLSLTILFALHGCTSKNPHVLISTELGDIVVEVYDEKAPITASNFLQYVNEDRFQGAVFYRVVKEENQQHDSIKIQVIQGGLFEDHHPNMLPPIEHETTAQTGIQHKDGTISMARWHPGTATSEFFICVGDQPELDYYGKRNPDKQGFAAFGKVVKGMDVVRTIHQQPDTGQYLNPHINIYSISLME